MKLGEIMKLIPTQMLMKNKYGDIYYLTDDYIKYIFGDLIKFELSNVDNETYPLYNIGYTSSVITPDYEYKIIGYSLQDEIINNFINREIGYNNYQLFLSKFRQLWRINKGTYLKAFNVWLKYYGSGEDLIFNDVPMFTDYFRKHQSEFESLVNASKTENNTSNTSDTANTSNTKDVTNTTDTTIKDTTVTNDDVDTTNNNTNNTSSTTTTTNTGTVKNDSTNDNVNDSQTSARIDVDSRLLTSDTPQSNLTGVIETPFNWTYASKVEDNKSTTNNTTNVLTTDKGNSTNTTTNNLTNETSLESNNTDAFTGNMSRDTTVTNDNTTNVENVIKDVFKGDITRDVNVEDNKTSNDNSTTNNTDNSTDTGYSQLEDKINSFLNSEYSTYYFNKVFNDFDKLFVSTYDLDVPLYIWKNSITKDENNNLIISYEEVS